MDKNINNIIFGIPNLMAKFKDSENKNDNTFEELAKFILSVNENDKDTNIYFIIESNLDLNNKDNKLEIINSQKDDVKNFLKNYKIKMRENNIKFVIKKANKDQVLDVDASIDDFVYIEDEQEISPDNTIVFFSESKFGEIAFLDGFFCIAIYSESLINNVDLKDFQKISNKIIDLNDEAITIDSLNYDFLTFNESHKN